jgi:uncharacterized protein YjlB
VAKNRALKSLDQRFEGVLQTPQVTAHLIVDDGVYPNNGKLPLLAYQGALCLAEQDLESLGPVLVSQDKGLKTRGSAAPIEALVRANGWGGSWRNGVYGYHHYHSTAHEVLSVYGGTAEVQFGGEDGVVVSIARGDVVIIPAGVAHKNLGSSSDFRVVGRTHAGNTRI